MAILTNRGVRLPLQKEPAANRPIEELVEVSKIYLPLSLGGDKAGSCVLHRYASVLLGQAVVKPRDPLGAPVLAPVSGVYTDRCELQHPLYGKLDCVVLDCMDAGRPAPGRAEDVDALSAAQVVDIARQHAVVDELDGRYVYEKLREWADAGCDVLVGDGVEDQPYASAAWEVLNESVEQVYAGLGLAARALGAPTAHLAVQQLPANHRRALCQRLGDDRLLYTVRSKYPAVTYTPRPFGKRVRRLGVQALLALYRAAAFHEPHTTGVVTVTGGAVSTPRNVRVPFGTPATALFRLCGLSADPTVLVFGDLMTGQVAEDPQTPILPGVTCLLALIAPPRPPADVCVGCGRCVQVCHAGLMPFSVVRQLSLGHADRLAALHPEDCDGCGACSTVCPAGLELSVQVAAAGRVCRSQTEGEETE